MKRRKNNSRQKDIWCPYCGSKAVLKTFRDVYGPNATNPNEKIWVCSNFENGCDAYVHTHKGTDKPYGDLANAKLRNLRIEAHRAINRVIRANIMDKHTIYDYLEVSFGMGVGKFHVGKSGEYQCKKVIETMDEILERKVGKKNDRS